MAYFLHRMVQMSLSFTLDLVTYINLLAFTVHMLHIIIDMDSLVIIIHQAVLMQINYKLAIIISSSLAYKYLVFSQDHQDSIMLSFVIIITNNTTNSLDQLILDFIIPSSFIVIIEQDYSCNADLLEIPCNQDSIRSPNLDITTTFIIAIINLAEATIIQVFIRKPFVVNLEFIFRAAVVYSNTINFIFVNLTTAITTNFITAMLTSIIVAAIAITTVITPIINTIVITMMQLVVLFLNSL